MIIDQRHLVSEFARRTETNLALVEAHHASRAEGFEVTQLINSMLGLLVFPQQKFEHVLENDLTPLTELRARGWPAVRIVRWDIKQPQSLGHLVRLLRHGIAHCNLELMSDDGETISGIRLWNHPNGDRDRPRNFECELTLADLRQLTRCFVQWIAQAEAAQAKD